MLSRTFLASASRASSRRAAITAPIFNTFGLRSYASAAPAGNTGDNKPPIPLYGVDGTYASATYTAASKLSSLDPTAKALSALLEVLKRDTKLPVLLSAPSLTNEDKSAIVSELQKHAGAEGKNEVVKNLLLTMAEHNRLGLLEGVCAKFGELISAGRGEVELVVTSAQKLDEKTLKRLETAVAKSEYSQGKKLKVVSKVNPDIIGGLVVEIGDRTIDLSVSNKVNKMNKLLTDAL